MKRIAALISLSLLALTTASADFVVSPQLARSPNADGPSVFTITRDVATSVRYQQVYSAQDFMSRSVTPVSISEISLGASLGSAPLDLYLQNVEIHFSTTTRNPDGLSSTFSENIGLNDLVVFSGPLHFFDSGSEVYGIHITLQNPFIYSPQAGNLLLDVKNFATVTAPAMGSYALLGEATLGDTVSSAARLNVGSLTGTLGTGGLVTRLAVTDVPEPKLCTLMVIGCSLFVFFLKPSRRNLKYNLADEL
jgi:hypothetical protein